jgi:hypothetical protein
MQDLRGRARSSIASPGYTLSRICQRHLHMNHTPGIAPRSAPSATSDPQGHSAPDHFRHEGSCSSTDLLPLLYVTLRYRQEQPSTSSVDGPLSYGFFLYHVFKLSTLGNDDASTCSVGYRFHLSLAHRERQNIDSSGNFYL